MKLGGIGVFGLTWRDRLGTFSVHSVRYRVESELRSFAYGARVGYLSSSSPLVNRGQIATLLSPLEFWLWSSAGSLDRFGVFAGFLAPRRRQLKRRNRL